MSSGPRLGEQEISTWSKSGLWGCETLGVRDWKVQRIHAHMFRAELHMLVMCCLKEPLLLILTPRSFTWSLSGIIAPSGSGPVQLCDCPMEGEM